MTSIEIERGYIVRKVWETRRYLYSSSELTKLRPKAQISGHPFTQLRVNDARVAFCSAHGQRPCCTVVVRPLPSTLSHLHSHRSNFLEFQTANQQTHPTLTEGQQRPWGRSIDIPLLG